MIDRQRFLKEMKAGIHDAFHVMITDHPDIAIYSISIWTDEGASRSAVSFDTFDNSKAKCRAANARRAAIRAQLSQMGAARKGPPDMARNDNPADFQFPKVVVIENKSFAAQAPFSDAEWKTLEDLMAEIKLWAAKESVHLNLHPDAEIGVSGRKTWYGSVIKIPCLR